MESFRTANYKFGASRDAGTAGGTVTWAVDPSVPSSFVPILSSAFNEWSNYADIQFKQVEFSASPTIKIYDKSIDGVGKTLSKYSTSYDFFSSVKFKTATAGSITFDRDENWHASGDDLISDHGSSLLWAALAEIGYTIGMSWNLSTSSLFSDLTKTELKHPSSLDIAGIRSIYGAASKYWYLVDQKFYTDHNPDLASTSFSPIEHYNNHGWSEGRDPNAYFSTVGYLAANPDLVQYRKNPLDHYDQYGWKEGRDPSAHFDNELYLAHNADVKSAGLDPLLHYLQFGKAEGRKAYDAIGMTSSFTHGSFDPEYYLLANPDIAKIVLNSNVDAFAFAYRHYDTYGWKEGRNPNAVFDTAYYLAKNPDVAAIHVDPLTHYDTFGWKEGRNPSAAFDTNAYLAMNSDVAAAHLDPLQHYLQYGALEGRHVM